MAGGLRCQQELHCWWPSEWVSGTEGLQLGGKDHGQSTPCPPGSLGLPQRLPWTPTAGRARQGTPAPRTRGTDSNLDFTTKEAALKSDAWLLEPNGEKSRLLPTAPAAHHLPGRWVSGTGGGHHLRSGSADLPEPPARLPGGWLLRLWADMRSPQPHKTATACCRLLPGEKLPGTPVPETGNCSFPVL